MKSSLLFAFAVLLSLAPLSSPANAAPLSGAIFTTTFDGGVVNENHFDSKCDVYLDGGPGPNAPAKAAGLPDGDYYFQVTDPSGKVLLSTDPVSNRRFQVSNGVIVAYTGVGGPPHPTGMDQDHPELGAVTVRLANTACPADYLDTPNGGGVYKVWATPAGEFVGDPAQVDNGCGSGCFHGFRPSKSKTDSFKADPSAPTFCLTIVKQLDDGSGQLFPYFGWQMSVTDPLGSVNVFHTDENGQTQICGLSEGAYTVVEDTPPDTVVVGLIVNGVSLPAESAYSFTWDPTKTEPIIVFHNFEDTGSEN